MRHKEKCKLHAEIKRSFLYKRMLQIKANVKVKRLNAAMLTGSQTYLLLTSKITTEHSEIEPEPVKQQCYYVVLYYMTYKKI